MRQAIVVKYLSPTDRLGGRVKATCNAKTLTFAWDYSLELEANAEHAALELAHLLGWTERNEFIGGSLPRSEGWVFVAVPKEGAA